MSATLTELLPARKSSKRSALNWTPAADNAFSPVAGVLAIHTDRATCSYRVEEFPADMPGRAFMLFKLDAGTDATEERYACFAPARGPGQCECKGFERFGHCKHIDAVLALLANGWL